VEKSMQGQNIYIIGGGVTGLSAAWQLAERGATVTVFEAEDHVGGMATTFRHGDFLLDLGPHKFFSVMEERMRLAEEIMGADFLTVPKRSRIRLAGRFLNYPVGLFDLLKNLNPFIAISGGLSYLWQMLRNLFDRNPAGSYEDYLVKKFGRRLYELIFAQYARKIWGDPRTLARSLAETRVAVPGLFTLLWRMLFARRGGPVIHAETFRYPKYGSGEFSERLAQLARENGAVIKLNATVSGIELDGGRVSALRLADARRVAIGKDDTVISTCAAAYLTRLVALRPPEDVLAAAERLKTRDLILLYVFLDRPSVSQDNWLFFPEAKYIFNRVFEQKNFSPFMTPQDRTVLCLEIVISSAEIQQSSPEVLTERALDGLEECGLINRSQVSETLLKRVKWAYPVYDLDYKRNAELVYRYLDDIPNLYSVGRQGGFNYIGQIDCLDIGIVTAEHVSRRQGKFGWEAQRRHFASYIVLD
jgi:protoporphyrinogen oxidase